MKNLPPIHQTGGFIPMNHRNMLTALAACAVLTLTSLANAQSYVASFLWYNTNGVANIANNSNNRGLACNVLSNQVYVADRNSTPGHISVFDGTSGAVLATNLPGITIAPYNVACADDGVIYAAPLVVTASASNLGIYSWQNWLASQYQCYTPSGSDATANPLVVGNRVGDTMAIFGGGVNTEIALWINSGSSTKGTTNLLVFTTTDGQNFTPTLISVVGLPVGSDSGPQHGIAFVNSTNIIYRPGFGSSVYMIALPPNFASLPSPVAASVVSTNTTLPSGGGSDVYLFSYSPDGKLLADYGQIVSSGSSTALGFYDISSFPAANNLGGTNTPHYNANGNFTGVVALGGQGKTNAVYVLDSNNGVWGFSLTFVAAAVSPVISGYNIGGVYYTNYGPLTFNVTAAGTSPLVYYWQYNTVSNQATATTVFVATNNGAYTINPLTVSASGWYDCIVSNSAGFTNTPPAQLTISSALTSPYVTNLWSLPADGSTPYQDTSYNTRGLAFDPNTMSLLLAEHSAAQIYALNATNGQFKFMTTTPQTGLPAGSIFPLGQVRVADDGAVYVCNVSSYQPGQQTGGVDFSITRFDSVVSATNADGSINPTNTFEAAFTGDPGAYWPGNPGNSSQDRWGDSMAVRGGGTNTQILLGSYRTVGANLYGSGPGTNVAIFTTADGINFTPTTVAVTNAPDGFSYLGVAWGAGNTFWAKSPGYDLYQIQYDLTTGIGWVIQDISSTTGSAGSIENVAGIGLDVANNILAGVNFGDIPNDVELFQIPVANNLADPYYQAFFPLYANNINGNAATDIKFPYIFSLDAINGIIGLEYAVPVLPFNITSTTSGNQQILTWPTVIGHSYQLQATNSLSGGAAGPWPNVGPAVTVPASGTLSYTNTVSGSSTMFYRVFAQ